MRKLRLSLMAATACAGILACSAIVPASAAASRRAMPGSTQLLGYTASASQSPLTVHPGNTGVVLFAVSITNNDLLGSHKLLGLRLTNTSTGSGTQAEMDAQLGPCRLYRDNGNGLFDAADVQLAKATSSGGVVTFSGFGQTLPAGAAVRLIVVTDVPLREHDGDGLDLAISSASDLSFDAAGSVSGSFPLAPAGNFTVDGMTGAQIAVNPIAAGSILASSVNALALDLVIPSNGYRADQLQQIAIVNTGTALPGTDITAMRVWSDNGDGSFDPTQDHLLGAMVFTGARWQLTGLAEPVPVGGLRVFVTVDVGDQAVEGHTIRLALPTLPDEGLGLASDDDGPLDRAVEAPVERVVSTADRVTVSAGSLKPAIAHPGDRDVVLLHVTASNSYGGTQTLDHLTVTNAGVGGTIADRDRAIQSLTLRADGDGDGALGDSLTDPPLGRAFFTDGQATFGGLALPLAAGATRGLFVTATIALAGATDGDTVSARIEQALDVGFADTTRVVGSWPVDSRARVPLDGMVAAQLALVSPPGATLAPGDSNVVALDLTIPRNGRLDDTLTGLTLVNAGSATDADVAELRLWRDGGDGRATPGTGDDRDLGAASWTGSGWQSAPLAEPLGAAGARIYAVLRVAGSAADSTTVRLGVPVDGVTVASGDDGPLDQSVDGTGTSLISNSPLLATLQITPSASTVGQLVQVAMAVRDVGTETIQSITPSALTASGGGALALQSGPTPASLTLAPGASDTLRWTYQAQSPGLVRLDGTVHGTGATSGTSHSSLDATSNDHQVYGPAAALSAAITATLPGSVARGQTGVVPFTLHLGNSGGAGAAPIALRAVRLALANDVGGGLHPSALLARAELHDGTTPLASTTAMDSTGYAIDLPLASPLVLAAGASADLTLSFDLLGSTTVTAFQAGITDSTWLQAADANQGTPVVVRGAGATFPAVTRVAQVVESATRLDVTAAAAPLVRVGPGESAVRLLSLQLVSPGTGGITSDVRVSALAVDAADTLGAQLASLGSVLEHLDVRSDVQSLGSRAVFTSDSARITLQLSPPLAIPVNTPVHLYVDGQIAGTAAPQAFRLRLADSTRVVATDANTHDRVAVGFPSDPLPGGTVVIELPADTLRVRGTPRFPAGSRAGDANVVAMTIVVRHPDGAGTARIRFDSLTVLTRDDARRPLAPAGYLDRVRVKWNGVAIGAQNNPPASGSATAIPLSAPTLAPGDSAVLELDVDFAATAPEGFLELAVAGDGIAAADANLGTRVTLVPDAGELPLVSGLTHLQAPARSLVVGLASLMPAALAGDAREVVVGRVTLANPAAAGAGAITVDHLTLQGADRAFAAVALGAGLERARAYVSDALWAESAALTPDSTHATLPGSGALSIAPGGSLTVELRVVPRPDAAGALRVGLDAAGVGVVQPSSALLQVQVQPASGQTFTLWTDSGSFSPLDLGASYSNFPNPFAAGREDTHFAYYLAAASRVSLRIYTLQGEPVRTVADGVARTAGMQQIDSWDGRNGVGRAVLNGVYIAELVVREDGGASHRVLRKVAVVR